MCYLGSWDQENRDSTVFTIDNRALNIGVRCNSIFFWGGANAIAAICAACMNIRFIFHAAHPLKGFLPIYNGIYNILVAWVVVSLELSDLFLYM